MTSKIGVGIVGLNAVRGWASDAHIPAIEASPHLELRALATSRRASADAAAAKFGVPGYDDPAEMAMRDDVDLVVISVKVPLHAQLIRAALSAGKPILCEWPLGNGLAEAVQLAAEAKAAGIRTFVGLQARCNPGYRHVRSLIAQGFVGEILSTSIVAFTGTFGPVIEPENAYLLDQANGATMVTIPFGHTIDAVCDILGEPDRLVAVSASQRDYAIENGTGRRVPFGIADQLVVGARLSTGTILSVHYRGGRGSGTGFMWQINGTEGEISVTAAHGFTEMTDLTVSGARVNEPLAVLPTPPDCRWAPDGTPDGVAYNIAQAYAEIVEDIRDGGHRVPDFDAAVARHRMLDAIEKAAATAGGQVLG